MDLCLIYLRIVYLLMAEFMYGHLVWILISAMGSSLSSLNRMVIWLDGS